MKLLLLSRSLTTHDDRFLEAWRSAGVDAQHFAVGEGTSESNVRALEKAIVDHSPDVVQAGPLTDVAWLATQVWQGPLVAVSWGFDLMSEILRDRDAHSKASHSLQRADLILVDNDAPMRLATELGGDPSRIVQFPWGTDLSHFSPDGQTMRDALGVRPKDLMVLSTRRHESIYDVQTLISAFLREARKDQRLHLVLAGAGTLSAALKELATEAALPGRIKFVGEVERPLLPLLYRAADMYVSTSHVDGTSVSLLEAMACGTPVCVTRIPGNAQWVTTETGEDFEVGNVDELARAIHRLTDVATATQRAQRARNALEAVARGANWEATTANFPHMLAIALANREKAMKL